MIIPNNCLKWLNLQRTGYKKPVIDFNKQIIKEYLEMKNYLQRILLNVINYKY